MRHFLEQQISSDSRSDEAVNKVIVMNHSFEVQSNILKGKHTRCKKQYLSL